MADIETIKSNLAQELTNYLEWIERNSVVPVESIGKVNQQMDVVMFSYNIDNLFENLKQITAIRAKHIVDKNSTPQIDDFTITDDERSWFDLICPDGAVKVYGCLTKVGKELLFPYLYDEGVVITDYLANAAYPKDVYIRYNNEIYKSKVAVTGIAPTGKTDDNWELESPLLDIKGKIVFLIDNNPDIPEGSFILMDNEIKEALKSYVLQEWYLLCGSTAEAAIHAQKFTTALEKVMSYSYLRKKPIRRKYSDFPI